MIGIDEVGRGAWAGPLLVVAARQLIVLPEGLADSKSITKKKREYLIESIEKTCELGLGWVWPREIDRHGLSSAMRLGVKRALESISANFDEEIIIDGNINYCESRYTNVKTEVKADGKVPLVSAASIYAKVARDNYMKKLDDEYSEYSFSSSVGYGTKKHLAAISKHGVTVHHRLSYKPVARLANGQ